MPDASQPSALYLEPSESAPREVDDAVASRLQMDEACFHVFYEQSAPRLFAYLLRVSGDRALAEDILQEAYCRFLSGKIPEMSQSSRQSYLFRIATNLLHDRWRRSKEKAMPEDFPEPSSGPPQLDRQLELRQAFHHLKVRERQLLWLAYVEGSNHKEIAEVTGLRHGSVRLLLFRARRKLADLIRAGNSSETERSQ